MILVKNFLNRSINSDARIKMLIVTICCGWWRRLPQGVYEYFDLSSAIYWSIFNFFFTKMISKEESSTKFGRRKHSLRTLCFSDWFPAEVSTYVFKNWNFSWFFNPLSYYERSVILLNPISYDRSFDIKLICHTISNYRVTILG
jgi:hypothetical protein